MVKACPSCFTKFPIEGSFGGDDPWPSARVHSDMICFVCVLPRIELDQVGWKLKRPLNPWK